MTQQTSHPLFDEIAANEAAQAGISRAASNNASVLDLAKRKAIELGRNRVFVTADDVQRELINAGLGEHDLGNAAGSVFRNKKLWIYTGRTVQSKRVSRHGALIRIWQYVGN